jgi:two-component system cell cycle sensor histidine kinase/response regulator CckA
MMILSSEELAALPFSGNRSAAAANGAARRVLLAEPNDVARRHTSGILRDAGYVVCDVSDAAQALFALRRGMADLAVVDAELPDKGGLDLLKDAGRHSAGVPVILYTTSYNVDRAVDAMKQGASDYLVKPFSPHRLLGAVARAVQGLQARAALPTSAERAERLRHAQRQAGHGILSGSAIHGISNSLTVSIGHAELLLAALDPADPLREHVIQFADTNRRADRFLTQLKRLANPTPPGARDIDLNLIVTRLGDLLSQLIRENISITAAANDSLGYVHADLAHMEQVLINLVLNARDAMPYGGQIIIRTANLDVDQPRGPVPPGAYVVLSVRDTGTGMSDEVQARMYDPFFTTKEPWEGAGLGLTVTADIIARAGGHITCDSHIGRGTDFMIYLPRIAANPTLVGGDAAIAGRIGV